MSSFASKIKPVGEVTASHGVKILVYGPAGAGKTTLATTTGERTLVLSAESGLLSVRASDLDVAIVTSIDDVRDALKHLKTASHPYRWVVLDSVSEIAEVLLGEEKERNKDPRKAYGELAEVMTKIIKSFRDLPLNVLFTCKQEQISDEGALRFRPAFPGQKLAGELPYLLDEVFAFVLARKEDGSTSRALLTHPSDKYEAKDRSGALDRWERPDLAAIAAKIQGKGAVTVTTDGDTKTIHTTPAA